MKMFKPFLSCVALIAIGTMAGCTNMPNRAVDVSGTLRTSLDQAGLKDVTASQDRDKGVVTLGGHVAIDTDKAQAETIARSVAGNQVVANQIEVLPVGAESSAKSVDADLDRGIESNLDAALLSEKLHHDVKYAVKNHVVTLTGDVSSAADRTRAERVASAVVNVKQVVNELQLKGQKATSTPLD